MQQRIPRKGSTLCGKISILTITAGLLAAALLGSLAAAPPASAEPARTVQVGVAVDGAEPVLVEGFEAIIGRQVDVVRVFKTWDDTFPTADDLALLESRDLALSIKAATDAGPIAWSDIAAAQPGDPLYSDMVRWAGGLAPYADQIHLTFHHEPEAAVNLDNGSAADFKAAWRHFMQVMSDEGVAPKTRSWIMTDYSFHVPAGDRRQAQKWYPGDAWVDAIGADAYNWYECRPHVSADWTPLSVNIEPLRQFGAAHPDKQLMLTELGSAEDPQAPTRKAEWIDDVAALMADPAYQQFTLVSWFDLTHPVPGTDCDWRIETSQAATDAFARLASAPAFGGDGPAPQPYCRLVRLGATATISWTADDSTHVIRRDGAWLATPPDDATSFVDADAPPDASYAVRAWVEGIRVEHQCVETQPDEEAPWCALEYVGAAVVLTWTDDGGLHVVRRDGDWLVTPGQGESTFTDTAPPPNAQYVIRTWNDGQRTDRPCEAA